MKILPDRIVWDKEDFLAGYMPEQSASWNYNTTGAAAMSNMDPFIIGPGIACVGANPTNVTGTSGGGSPVPNSVLVDAKIDLGGNNAYAIGTDVHKFQVFPSDFLSGTAPFPHAIDHSHTSETGALGAIEFYYTSGTANVVFFSFNDATDGDVGTYDVAADAFKDNFMSTVPTGAGVLTAGKAHPLLRTSDDLLLMGDGRNLHSFKASTNTRTANHLQLPSNFEIVGMVEMTDSYDTVVFATTARGTAKRGQAKAFFWSIDRPTSYYRSPPIPDDDVAAPFVFLGTVGCFTKSRTSNADAVLRLFENGEWVPKFTWAGSLPAVGGVEIQDHTVAWISDGLVYRWGPRFGQFPRQTYQPQSGSGTSNGFLKSFSNGTTSGMYGSSGSGTSGVQVWGSFGTGSWQGANAAPLFAPGRKGKVTMVQIHLAGGSSAGGGRELKLDLMDDTFVGSEIFSAFTNYTTGDTLKKYLPESFTTRIEEFVSIGPLLTWSAGSGATNPAAIERIEVFYEEVEISNSQP